MEKNNGDPERIEQFMNIEVERVTDGLGFGEGAISYQDRLDSGEVDSATMDRVVKLVESPEILVPIDKDKDGQPIDDDGCGDGREVGQVFKGAELLHKSLNRAKVFGGGVAMAASGLIGLGKAAGQALQGVFRQGRNVLKDKGINFGAHTDTHAHGPNCGCGALDKAPQAVTNAVKFESEIRATIAALGVDDTGLGTVYDNYRQFVLTMDADNYSGKVVADEITADNKVVKRLDGEHREMLIVLNMVAGHTVDQAKVRQVSTGKVQVFAVDVWRMQELAAAVSDEPLEQQQAFLSELVYTLGVAATLTKGDLPVYVIKQKESIAA